MFDIHSKMLIWMDDDDKLDDNIENVYIYNKGQQQLQRVLKKQFCSN